MAPRSAIRRETMGRVRMGRMIRIWTAAVKGAGGAMLAICIVGGAADVAAAQGVSELSCSELWYARNRLYAEAGYCFKTDRAIAVFGRRCHPPYGELSGGDRRQMEEIQYWERRKGCSD
jgi:hypothetical protein